VNKDASLTWREDGGYSKLVPLHPLPKNKTLEDLPKYTMKQVAEKTTSAEMWIVIDELVYDITNFISKHPGGDKVLLNMAGKDCTDAFANYHQARIYQKWLPPYLVGRVTDVPVYPHVQDFREIRQELLRKGLFETSTVYYCKLYTWFATLFCVAMYLSLKCTSTASHMLGALVLGFFWQQVAGWGHDLGHSSVSHDFTFDNWIGSTVGCAVMGISTGWWKRSHNTHHVVCNSIENDPDIQHMPVLAVTDGILEKPFWSSYHSKVISVDAFSRFFIRHQHILFFPIMMFARFNLYFQSWNLILTTTNKESIVMYFRLHEVASLLFFATWVTAVALSMPTWGESIAWVVISHAVTALLHIQICMSHFSMDTYHGKAYNDASDEWYKMQIKTSMNVGCAEWFDFFHIGLQFQVEHHLYPTLPRHNLRIAKDMVKQVCKKHGIQYYEYSFYEAVKKTVLTLRETAMKARSGKYDHQSTSMIRDLLNASG
jgi:fatty acid desaturase